MMKTKVTRPKTRDLILNIISLKSEVEELNTIGIMDNPKRLHLIKQLNEAGNDNELIRKKLDNIKSTLQPMKRIKKEQNDYR